MCFKNKLDVFDCLECVFNNKLDVFDCLECVFNNKFDVFDWKNLHFIYIQEHIGVKNVKNLHCSTLDGFDRLFPKRL